MTASHERRLDQLAWLIEGPSTCAAVSCVKDKFYIAANELYIGTQGRDKNQNLAHICTVMEYFRDVANADPSMEEGEKRIRRDKLIQSIVEYRIDAIGTGKIQIPAKVMEVFANTHRLEIGLEPIKDEEIPITENRENAYLVFGFGLAALRRILKIESSIEKQKKGDLDSKITTEQLNAFRNFQYADETRDDSGILFDEMVSNVHAEMQILSRATHFIEQNVMASTDEAYIGISKRCCLNCHCMLDAANQVFEKPLIKFEGAHDASFLKNWNTPARFFPEDYTDMQDNAQDSLAKRIRDAYDADPRIIAQEDEEKKKRKKTSSYQLIRNDSDSNASLTSMTEIAKYKERLTQDLMVLRRLQLEKSEAAEMLELGIDLCALTNFKNLFETEALPAMAQDIFDAIHFELNAGRENNIDEKTLLQFLRDPTFSIKAIVDIFKDFTLMPIPGLRESEDDFPGASNQGDATHSGMRPPSR